MPDSESIARAAQLDEAGDHEEAINCLARAVSQDDLLAMTALAKRLLSGDRAPCLPKEAVGFLLEAAHKGEAEAPALLSVLFAIGYRVPQSWHSAQESMATAASRGWEPARQQLRLLSGRQEAEGEQDWQELALQMDMAAWERAPKGENLNQSPLVRRIPDFIDPAVCAWLIERSRNRLVRARVYDPVQRIDIEHSDRNNTSASFNLAETDLVNILVQTRMAAATGIPFRHLEGQTILHYSPGEEIRNHFDFVDPETPDYENEIRLNGQRIITFLLYLNDDYEGGSTDFPKLEVSHKGRTGEGLFFVNAHPDGSSDLRTLHAGRPPLSGEKWVVSQFIRSRPALN